MRLSVAGAGVGALVGALARAAVVLLNVGDGPGLGFLALPSAGIGALVGAVAGATGRPLRGAVVGAVLSGVVFELFMFACASAIGHFDPEGARKFLGATLVYALEMAAAGALAGAAGGAAALAAYGRDHPGAGPGGGE
jgi:hypothetical protein